MATEKRGYAYFLVIGGEPASGPAVRDWFNGAPIGALKRLPNVRAIELSNPEASSDPYLDDGPGPLLMLQLDFASLDDAQSALNSEIFAQAVGDLSAAPAKVTGVADLMEVEFFPVAGQDAPMPRTAPVSYVVRYHRPAEDEAAFVANYRRAHPPILGKFANVRNVICYYPVAWHDETEIPSADYMLGNEVVFDTVEDLNASLASDIRHELREDFKTFPPFTGRNTHYAMTRKRVGP
jgi:hypothetical protein